jgi:hypothetical protein
MFDLSEASKVLQSWPVVNGFFIIVISFLTIMAIRKGEKDRKLGEGSEVPVYLVGRPAHDMMNAIQNMEGESRKTNANLADIIREFSAFNRGQGLTHELLQDIRNNQELRDPVKIKRGV